MLICICVSYRHKCNLMYWLGNHSIILKLTENWGKHKSFYPHILAKYFDTGPSG